MDGGEEVQVEKRAHRDCWPGFQTRHVIFICDSRLTARALTADAC